MRASQFTVVATATAALAFPAGADAATSYVVTLAVPVTATCEQVVAGVTTDHAITPKLVYRSALCGFSASLSSAKARSLAADPRVAGVQEDTGFSAS